MYTIKGTLYVIRETKQVSEKFALREFVIRDESGQYPQTIQLQFTQNNCAKLDGCKIGDEVEVKFNLRGREWNSPQGDVKYFNTLEAWELNILSGANAVIPTPEIPEAPVVGGEDDSDLPF
jgi:hypothetical protein